jgi:hypothetical protein
MVAPTSPLKTLDSMPPGPAAAMLDRLERRAVERWGGARTAAGLMVGAMLVWPVLEWLGGRALNAVHPLELVWLRYAVHLLLLLLFSANGSRTLACRSAARC